MGNEKQQRYVPLAFLISVQKEASMASLEPQRTRLAGQVELRL